MRQLPAAFAAGVGRVGGEEDADERGERLGKHCLGADPAPLVVLAAEVGEAFGLGDNKPPYVCPYLGRTSMSKISGVMMPVIARRAWVRSALSSWFAAAVSPSTLPHRGPRG